MTFFHWLQGILYCELLTSYLSWEKGFAGFFCCSWEGCFVSFVFILTFLCLFMWNRYLQGETRANSVMCSLFVHYFGEAFTLDGKWNHGFTRLWWWHPPSSPFLFSSVLNVSPLKHVIMLALSIWKNSPYLNFKEFFKNLPKFKVRC